MAFCVEFLIGETGRLAEEEIKNQMKDIKMKS